MVGQRIKTLVVYGNVLFVYQHSRIYHKTFRNITNYVEKEDGVVSVQLRLTMGLILIIQDIVSVIQLTSAHVNSNQVLKMNRKIM